VPLPLGFEVHAVVRMQESFSDSTRALLQHYSGGFKMGGVRTYFVVLGMYWHNLMLPTAVVTMQFMGSRILILRLGAQPGMLHRRRHHTIGKQWCHALSLQRLVAT
jgi:hypothetical protein